MSIRLFSQCWDLQFKPASDKWVLMALADAANDDGVTWMAVKSRKAGKLDLMRKASLSERAVQGAIQRLVAAGYLIRHENPGRGCIYVVVPTPAEFAGVDMSIFSTTPAKFAPTPAGFAGAPADAAGKPSLNPQLNKKREANCGKPVDICSVCDRVLPDGLLAGQWDAYLAMRRTIDRPVSVGEAQVLLIQLDALVAKGGDPSSVVNWAIIHGHVDFLPAADVEADFDPDAAVGDLYRG